MINVRNLKKTFGTKVAVNGISFTVEKGEVLGFLGPNGAGKSTSMRMITGFIPPSSGEISVGGHDMLENPLPAKRLIGYLPENAPLYTDMTVLGFLEFAASMRGLTGAARQRAVNRAIEMCFLESVRHQSIETLSKGYRHRTCFAQSIIHDPEVLILDEPTDGLDPNQKHEIRSLIRRMGDTKAIIFSTHILEEVEAVCSRAIIVDRGAIVANGTPLDLKRRSANCGSVVIRLAEGAIDKIKQRVDRVETVASSVILAELSLRVVPSKSAAGPDFARSLGQLAYTERWPLLELHTEEGRLDEVFRSITMPDNRKTNRETANATL